MSTVRRPSALTLVLDLTRRLAEEFESVPLPMVSGAVKSAVAATELFGNNVADSLDTIEQIAREDLTAIRNAATDSTQVALAG